jgi:hypothetical protein
MGPISGCCREICTHKPPVRTGLDTQARNRLLVDCRETICCGETSDYLRQGPGRAHHLCKTSWLRGGRRSDRCRPSRRRRLNTVGRTRPRDESTGWPRSALQGHNDRLAHRCKYGRATLRRSGRPGHFELHFLLTMRTSGVNSMYLHLLVQNSWQLQQQSLTSTTRLIPP